MTFGNGLGSAKVHTEEGTPGALRRWLRCAVSPLEERQPSAHQCDSQDEMQAKTSAKGCCSW